MNYLGRPVFLFDIDWGNQVNKSFLYDLKEAAIGFGAEIFTSLQQFTVQGYQFSLFLQTDADVQALDDFTAALSGRLVGFWLPAPINGMEIAAGVSGTQFDIVAEGLTETWQDNPDQYLLFNLPGAGPQAVKITDVSDLGTGRERVTVDQALNPAPDRQTGYVVQRLHYVRLSEDLERGQFMAEGWQTRQMKVIELPLEYAQAETGEQPIYLYHFWAESPANIDWYFTSFAVDVVSNGILYAARPITHGELKNQIKAENSLDVTMAYTEDNPMLGFFPLPLARPLNIQVLEASFATPDTAAPIFTGQVRTVDDQGESLVAHCDTFANVIKRKVPRMVIQATCPYWLYDLTTCKVERNLWETTGIVETNYPAALPPRLDVTLAFPDSGRAANWESENWFAQGFVECGFGTDYETATIIASSYAAGVLTLTLTVPLNNAQPGFWVQLVPGCDRSSAMCKSKFANFNNFGGFVNIPVRNPCLSAGAIPVSGGGKK